MTKRDRAELHADDPTADHTGAVPMKIKGVGAGPTTTRVAMTVEDVVNMRRKVATAYPEE
jgi:hypothetical protein